MAINYPGPFEVRVNYVTDENIAIRNHQLRMSTIMSIEGEPGSPFADWFPEQKGGDNSIALSTHTENLLNIIKAYHNTAVAYSSAELWEYAPGTFDSVFRAAYSPTAEPTGVPTTVEASQVVMTWRTIAGGILKLTWMGSHVAPGATIPAPGSGGIATAFNYMTADACPWVGRDGSYAVAGIAFHPGQNEALWKRVNRP